MIAAQQSLLISQAMLDEVRPYEPEKDWFEDR